MPLLAPGSVGILHLYLRTNKGYVDLKRHTKEIRIFESMMRPYIVTEVALLDSNNFGNTLRIEGGEELSGSALTAEGSYVEFSGKCFKQDTGDSVGKSVGTLLHFATEAYFGNKENKVTGAWTNIIGTDLISQIANKYLGKSISKLIPSLGFHAENQPYKLNNVIPFDAINQIRQKLTSAAFSKTGAYTFFQNNIGLNLIPLEQLFSELAPQGYFIQDPTIGSSFLDIKRITSQIISFKAGSSFGGSTVDPSNMYRNLKTENHNFNLNKGKFTRGQPENTYIPRLGVSIPFNIERNIGKIAGNFSFTLDDLNLRQLNPEKIKANGEKVLGYMTQGSGTWTMTVLLDRGVKLTVGKGVYAKPLLPIGDLTSMDGMENRLGGEALVVNLTHLIKNYDVKPQGFTTVECAQGGFNV